MLSSETGTAGEVVSTAPKAALPSTGGSGPGKSCPRCNRVVYDAEKVQAVGKVSNICYVVKVMHYEQTDITHFYTKSFLIVYLRLFTSYVSSAPLVTSFLMQQHFENMMEKSIVEVFILFPIFSLCASTVAQLAINMRVIRNLILTSI